MPLPEMPAVQSGLSLDDSARELKQGAIFNALAVLATNFRSIFTFLVARLLGPALLGTYMVAWAATDLISKFGVLGLDTTITTFIARAEAMGDRARSRSLFYLAVGMVVSQCAIVAVLAILVIRSLGEWFGMRPEIIGALSVMLCALPGVVLYRMSTAVSRGMKVMRHDIFSRGLTDSFATTLAFLSVFALGYKTYAPEIALIVGSAASGLVAFFLARSLFRNAPRSATPLSFRLEARRMFAFAAPISIYDLINSAIQRVDVIILACFIGRAPGVTLTAVGIYGTVVEVASGLRKVNQAFNPIFSPIVAGMTVHGEQERAAAAFSRVAQWMLWILLPLVALMTFAGPIILGIYGPAFPQGSRWLIVVAIACATNGFVGLAETVIMVQKPQLNLRNSAIACVVALAANAWLIALFGVMGAAFGILVPYVTLGLLRYQTLRRVFGWANPWSDVGSRLLSALIAGVPAVAAWFLLYGLTSQITATLIFLSIYFVLWRRHRARE